MVPHRFYTRIPHAFGMRRPPVVSSLPQIRNEMKLMDALSDIKVTLELMDQKTANAAPEDSYFSSLNCNLTPIDKSSDDFGMIAKFVF